MRPSIKNRLTNASARGQQILATRTRRDQEEKAKRQALLDGIENAANELEKLTTELEAETNEIYKTFKDYDDSYYVKTEGIFGYPEEGFFDEYGESGPSRELKIKNYDVLDIGMGRICYAYGDTNPFILLVYKGDGEPCNVEVFGYDTRDSIRVYLLEDDINVSIDKLSNFIDLDDDETAMKLRKFLHEAIQHFKARIDEWENNVEDVLKEFEDDKAASVSESRIRRFRRGRMLKESESPVNLSNYRAKFTATGFEPVDDIVDELGFEQGMEYDLKDIALRLFDEMVNTEEWTFGASPSGNSEGKQEIDIMVFDEYEDKVGDLFFEMTTKVDDITMIAIFDKLNDMLVNGN